MSRVDVIRAWRDPQYRRSLTEEQRSELPQSPAGRVQVDDRVLSRESGAGEDFVQTTAWFCTLYTFLARCC